MDGRELALLDIAEEADRLGNEPEDPPWRQVVAHDRDANSLGAITEGSVSAGAEQSKHNRLESRPVKPCQQREKHPFRTSAYKPRVRDESDSRSRLGRRRCTIIHLRPIRVRLIRM